MPGAVTYGASVTQGIRMLQLKRKKKKKKERKGKELIWAPSKSHQSTTIGGC